MIPAQAVAGGEQLFLVSNRHVFADAPSSHFPDRIDIGLRLEADRMLNTEMPLDEVESERTVIISELQGAENDPDQVLDTEVTAAALTTHPYRHPTIGWLSDLETMGGSLVRRKVTLQQGIPTEAAKDIVKFLKDQKLRKVQAAIQGDQLRVHLRPVAHVENAAAYVRVQHGRYLAEHIPGAKYLGQVAAP